MGAPTEAREPSSASEDSEASCSRTEGLVVPEGIPSLRGVRYVHGAFPESFLRKLERVREETPVTLASGNMYADRRFLRDDALAREVLSHLPKHLGFAHVLSDMRFIEYPPGGHILPHTDGVRRDDVTGKDSTHSMLLFTRDVPEGEGGETEFLDGVGQAGGVGVGGVGSVRAGGAPDSRRDDGDAREDDDARTELEEPRVLFAARPKRGSVLLFPHDVAHRGACVGTHAKVLLRGDLY
jgi:hypothetical protein